MMVNTNKFDVQQENKRVWQAPVLVEFSAEDTLANASIGGDLGGEAQSS